MNSRGSLFFLVVALCFSTLTLRSIAQTETATVSGRVSDQQGAILVGAQVSVTNVDTNFSVSQGTNREGLYVIPGLRPGRYRITVTSAGFRTVNLTDVVLNVQDSISQNFRLQVGSVSEFITVVADEAKVNTESAVVSTVVDRQFAENLPMNGRSFQALIQLTPGVVLTPSSASDSGQFSVNGQRATSNYWMVDGVSANIGISSNGLAGNGLAGSLGSFSAMGGTNSLVSVDALQEFRILTSTYAPEFGRTPGGQISIATRSGTNQFHGSLFHYFRNDILDANDWFADNKGLPKPQERQNDFGGTVAGPILRERSFFFFSYEGLRLRLPQTALTTVPDLVTRQNAVPAMQPYLNAFPMPNPNESDVGNGIAPFNASYSNSSTLDAYSVRIDHRLGSNINLFGRYNYSPSNLSQRGPFGDSLSVVDLSKITIQTATLGAVWAATAALNNDLRFNYSRTNGSGHYLLDRFGGAIPLPSLPFPGPYTDQNSLFAFGIFSLSNSILNQGHLQRNVQRQINIVDNLTVQTGSHTLKVGVDFRRLSPLSDAYLYSQQVNFLDVPSSQTGNLFDSVVVSGRSATFLFRNLGVFAQDTWRIAPRLTLTYGLRWDVDFTPASIKGPSLPAVINFENVSQLALAPAGAPPFRTTYGNVAPRLGVAYQLSENQERQTVIRGGLGIFLDLATSEAGNIFGAGYPFNVSKFNFGGTFPLDPTTAAPSPIVPASLSLGAFYAFDPNLKPPYTLQWNVALEQGLGRQQTISASYVGSAGKRLIQSAYIISPNPNFGAAYLTGNSGTSDYDALQVQFQRRLSRGLQALASYSWSHSIDDASAGSAFGNQANARAPGIVPSTNRGPSDFDIRNAFSTAMTYSVPAPRTNPFANAILGGWAVQNVIQARTAPPVNIYDSMFFSLFNGVTQVRPDLVPGIPLYLYGPQYAGGKIFNNTVDPSRPTCKGPFCPPPTDPNTGAPLRQGNLPRNALRGFGATQWDLAIHRDFPIHESLKVQFRAEMFNVLNHPNFGQPKGDINNARFGQTSQMLGRSLDVFNQGSGSFSPLYQIGSPRSIQFGLKMQF